MRRQNREFLHLLAEDWGLESESLDPEPYRSVVVRKPISFHYKPRKTISEFIATPAKPVSEIPTTTGGLQQLKKSRATPLSNALHLTSPRVGLLTSELEKELAPVLAESQLRFTISWTTGGEEILLTPKPSSLGPEQVDGEIKAIVGKIRRRVAQTGVAGGVEAVEAKDGKVVVGEGWNVVGAGSGARAWTGTTGATVARNRFDMTPLPKVPALPAVKKVEKKKVKEEEVLESWDMELDEEEEEAQPEEAEVEGKGKGKEAESSIESSVPHPTTATAAGDEKEEDVSSFAEASAEVPAAGPSTEPSAVAAVDNVDAAPVAGGQKKEEEMTV